jgi:hypothetical protein
MDTWTPEIVLARLIEAAEVIAITTRRDGHKALRSIWPEWQRDYAGGNRRPRRTASPEEIARAEEAMTWYALIDDEIGRCALQYQVLSAAAGVSFRKICNNFGWKRATIQSRNNVELKRLSEKLNLDNVPRHSAAPRQVRPIAPKTDAVKGNLDKCANEGPTFYRDFEKGTFNPENFDPTWAREQAEKRRRKLLGAEIEEEHPPGR